MLFVKIVCTIRNGRNAKVNRIERQLQNHFHLYHFRTHVQRERLADLFRINSHSNLFHRAKKTKIHSSNRKDVEINEIHHYSLDNPIITAAFRRVIFVFFCSQLLSQPVR